MEIKFQIDNLLGDIKEFISNIESIEQVKLMSLIQQCILSILEYTLLGNYVKTKDINLDYKSVLINYINNLRKYFIKDTSVTSIIKKLILNRQEHTERETEGFINSDEEEKSLLKQISIGQKQIQNNDDPELIKVKDLLNNKDNEIAILKVKLQMKEQKLLDLANGYLKDLQNMREQMFRKSDDFDYYEVQYCDVTDIEDSRYRELVNNKIANLKSQYEKKTREIFLFVQKQKQEIQQMKQLLSSQELKIKAMDNLEYLMNRIFQLESDPYRVWKYIQDLRGNDYFKDVFEKQKPSTGINYREINKLLMVTKAYDRELEYYKKGIEDQMVIYLERACGIINLVNQDQLDEIQQLKDENQKLQISEQRILDIIKQELIEYKNILNNHQQQYIEIKEKEHTQLQKMQLKYATKIWSLFSRARFMNANNLKEMILYAYKNDYEKLTSDQFVQLENKYLQIVIQNKTYEESIKDLQSRLLYHEAQHQEIADNNKQLKEQIEDYKTKLKNNQKFAQLVIKHIDSKINYEQLNLEDNNRATTKSFKERLKELRIQKNGLKYTENIQEQYEKNQLALDFMQNSTENKGTQTVIGNVSQTLVEAIQIYEQCGGQEQISQHTMISITPQIKTNDVECQTDLININEMEKQIEDLNQQIKYFSSDIDELQIIPSYKGFINRNPSQSFDVNSSQKSTIMRRRYGQINESKEDPLNGITQQIIQQQQQNIEINDKLQERQAQTQNLKRGVFNRLFEDSKKKQERIQQIKHNLEVLEREHWQQIVELVKEDKEVAQIFQDSITSSKHFYQQQLQRNILIEQKYFLRSNRAQFYFKKFKDFHIYQNGSIGFDPLDFENQQDNALQKINIQSVFQKGKIRIPGLKHEEQQFFSQLESSARQKRNISTFRSTQQSPKRKYVPHFPQKATFLASQTSYDMNDFNHQQITKHLQKAYDLG